MEEGGVGRKRLKERDVLVYRVGSIQRKREVLAGKHREEGGGVERGVGVDVGDG